MSTNTIDSANSGPPEQAAAPKGARKAGKKAKLAKKSGRAKKPASKPKADRSNKKAEVIAIVKRAKRGTLGEVVE
jgi:hypothetical protein